MASLYHDQAALVACVIPGAVICCSVSILSTPGGQCQSAPQVHHVCTALAARSEITAGRFSSLNDQFVSIWVRMTVIGAPPSIQIEADSTSRLKPTVAPEATTDATPVHLSGLELSAGN